MCRTIVPPCVETAMGEYQQREIVRLRADLRGMEQQLAALHAKVAEAELLLGDVDMNPDEMADAALTALRTGDSE